jgi:hypothetical protein
VHWPLHSAKKKFKTIKTGLPSVGPWHSVKRVFKKKQISLPSVGTVALGKEFF